MKKEKAKKEKIQTPNFKVGLGYDIHGLVQGRRLVLGGVEIPYEKGLLGHSDADVLLHAIGDALLGAMGQGDIGEHFPNTDERFRGISSLVLIEKIRDLMKSQGHTLNNVDCVIIAQEPKLQEYKEKIKKTVAMSLDIPASSVNIKATTNEGLGALGHAQGIAAYAVVLLREI